jgi:hypothetical protein
MNTSPDRFAENRPFEFETFWKFVKKTGGIKKIYGEKVLKNVGFCRVKFFGEVSLQCQVSVQNYMARKK